MRIGRGHNRYVSRQVRVERSPKGVGREGGRRAEGNHLAVRMRTGVGPAGSYDPDLLAGDCSERPFKRRLHCFLPWLPLEAGIAGSDVLDDAPNPARL
jgi:hypothetical protein